MSLPTDAMPGNCHPAYDELADPVRSMMAHRDQIAVAVAVPQSLTAHWTDGLDDPVVSGPVASTRLLQVRRCAAGAPWTYRPARYSWFAATDELGRSIGGDKVELVTDPADYLRFDYWSASEIAALPDYAPRSRLRRFLSRFSAAVTAMVAELKKGTR